MLVWSPQDGSKPKGTYSTVSFLWAGHGLANIPCGDHHQTCDVRIVGCAIATMNPPMLCPTGEFLSIDSAFPTFLRRARIARRSVSSIAFEKEEFRFLPQSSR
jgi:hypothetical protein